jgi:hypothetical protein
VLLEREQLPRYKRCGGGMIGASQAAVAAAGVDLAPLSLDRVGRFTFTCRGGAGFTRETARCCRWCCAPTSTPRWCASRPTPASSCARA